MIWRGGRAHPGKQDFVVLDHVNMYLEFGHPLESRVWNFSGRKKREKKDADALKFKLCPDTGLYCDRTSCVGCVHNKTQRRNRAQAVVDCAMGVVDSPIEIKKAPRSVVQELDERLNAAIDDARTGDMSQGLVGEVLKIAELRGRSAMWCYHRLNANRHLVNVTLLHEIARQKKYKPGWAWMKKNELERRRR
jgi:hypothetical protein